MTTSPKGRYLIESWEKLSLCPYADCCGVPTQGFGHTAGVSLDDPPCLNEQAVAWLEEDLAYVEGLIAKHVLVPLNQNQYDALVSLIFNIGPGRRGLKDGIIELKGGGPSTLLRHLRVLDYEGAGQQFSRWVWGTVDGKLERLPGLVTRRAAERALFETSA